MKKLVTFLIIIGLAIVFFYVLDNMPSDSYFGDSSSPHSSTFKKISASIDSIQGMPWRKALAYYHQLESIMKAKKEFELLTGREVSTLYEKLNFAYISILIAETKAFFAGACTDRVLLSDLNKELRRFRDDMVDKSFRSKVDSMRTATSSVYGATSYRDRHSNQRKGLSVAIDRYIDQGDFDINTSKNWKNKISYYGSLPYLSGCTMIANSNTANMQKLDRFHYTSLKKTISNYANSYMPSDSLDTTKHSELVDRVSTYSNILYGDASKGSIDSLNTELNKILNSHPY